MHALLFRKWKNRVKGRDWYDFEWYVKKGIPLNLTHFLLRAKDSKDYEGDLLKPTEFKQMLIHRIEIVSVDQIKEDILPFIEDSNALNIWSTQYFKDLVDKVKFIT